MKRIISAGLCTAFILSLAGCARQDTTPSLTAADTTDTQMGRWVESRVDLGGEQLISYPTQLADGTIVLMEKEAQAEYAELLRRLYEAISSLTPAQARRVHARYMLGMKVKDIAAMEGITPSQAGKSIHAALRRLRRYFIRRKWTSGL